MSRDDPFDAFPVDLNKIHTVAIENAFDHGGPDFTNLICALIFEEHGTPPRTNASLADIRAKLREIAETGKEFFKWDVLSEQRAFQAARNEKEEEVKEA